jgi:hypothetical protein
MKLFVGAAAVLLICAGTRAALSQTNQSVSLNRASSSLSQKFFSDFDLPAASEGADARLHRAPSDVQALFVRMEAAELLERPAVVLDSALRLCNLNAAPGLHEVASDRVLQHAANTQAFNAVLRRVKLAAAAGNDCSFNLRLALVAAATDGANLDLDSVTRSSGLLTRWQIVGPFGHYNNVDFDRRWLPQEEKALRPQYSSDQDAAAVSDDPRAKPAAGSHIIAPERFWFRDGMVSLPEYAVGSGIFYAASELEIANTTHSQIDVLSPGAYEVFVDGKSVLVHDSRYSADASRDSGELKLAAGHHRILVKFTADAAPLSIAIHPQSQRTPTKAPSVPPAFEEYAQQMTAYFRGNFTEMERLLDAIANRSVYAPYMRALLYSAAEDRSPRADAAWKALASAQPAALLARLKSDESAMERGQNDSANSDVMNILAERPQSESALQLAFSLSRNKQADAPALLSRLLESHPSCIHLVDAIKFYNSTAEQDKASGVEQQLAKCAPENLHYARVLADSGRHSAAAAYLQQIVAKNPLNRAARKFLIEQLALDNQLEAAELQARQLSEIALNTRSYDRLVEDPNGAQDSKSQRAEGFAQGAEFYVPYRRDGVDVVQQTAQRQFSGGAAVVLLSDKVISVQRSGAVSVYVHCITRPLSKEGISRYGEVVLPGGADLLELRTIKVSGEVIEPELVQQKATISMPALEPGDAIEEEYVMHYPEADQMPEGAGALTFGSFAAPILYSRLVLLGPADAKISVREQAAAPQPLVGENNGMVIRIWERNNISQTISESYLPAVNLLPTVTVAAAEKSDDQMRDALIDATRIGIHVNEAAAEIHLPQDLSETEKAKRLYHFVTNKMDSTGPNWADSSAEDAFSSGQGSRTMGLMALARATGMRTGLVLARRIDQHCGKEHSLSCNTHPLVRFWLSDGETVDADAESDDLPFGAIPPYLDLHDALLVSFQPDEDKRQEIMSSAGTISSEESAAEGNLTFHDNDLVADIQVRLGSTRAQEVRSLLRNAGDHDRQAFFEQLAMRIFPGATSVVGSAMHENDPEQALRLSLHCTVQQFINRQSSTSEIEQLAPALGLAPIYAKTTGRKFPLYIESLYFESTVFHLHLPAGMDVRSLPADFAGKSEFGEYTLRFVRGQREVDIRRDFKIPVQIVARQKYASFRNFANLIDEAERQRISLETVKGAASGLAVRLK